MATLGSFLVVAVVAAANKYPLDKLNAVLKEQANTVPQPSN
jgi:hypothetical protein